MGVKIAMQYNPYDYMLQLRNNRVLFQYLEVSAVNYTDELGWSITGHTKEGTTEIYETSSGVLRFTLPIPIPQFIKLETLQKIIEGLQPNIEGIVTAAEEEGILFIEYHLHSTTDNDSLDKGLLKFLQERSEINKGFLELEQEYLRMEKAMNSMSEGLSSMMNPRKPTSGRSQSQPGEPDLSSLWSEMEEIDSRKDEDDDNDIYPTDPTGYTPQN